MEAQLTFTRWFGVQVGSRHCPFGDPFTRKAESRYLHIVLRCPLVIIEAKCAPLCHSIVRSKYVHFVYRLHECKQQLYICRYSGNSPHMCWEINKVVSMWIIRQIWGEKHHVRTRRASCYSRHRLNLIGANIMRKCKNTKNKLCIGVG